MKLSKMKKEDLELLSYTKIAELYLQENKITMTTAELFKVVCDLLELDSNEYQERIADFFESLTTSKDFILLNNGNWDLKINHKVKIDIDEIYEEKDDDFESEDYEDESEELEEEIEEDIDTVSDDDYEDDELGDLTIVDEDELDS